MESRHVSQVITSCFSAVFACLVFSSLSCAGPEPSSADAPIDSGSSFPSESQTDAHRSAQKRVLIVAIGQYDPSTGWWNISSQNDVPLIRSVLAGQGFKDIHILRNEEATRQGIVDAFDQHLLRRARKGDVVVFHYSGHGQQITDDNGDELDGYDEALVPYDAPLEAKNGYRGEKHLRDDLLSSKLQELRGIVGPTGNVVVFMDSCFSGTGTRGEAKIRGSHPIGEPAKRTQRSRGVIDEGSGFYELAAAARGTSQPADQGRAPYVVFAASLSNKVAHETKTEDGTPVGSLTYGISRGLENPNLGPSYRNLFEEVEWVLQKRVPNTPQVEGDVDSQIFSGQAIKQHPYVRVASVASNGTTVTLEAGSLAGLLPGSEVELHRAGTQVPTEETRIAKGAVTRSRPLGATIQLKDPVQDYDLKRSWVFVTKYSFGDLRIRVRVERLGDPTMNTLREELAQHAAVEPVEANADLLVTRVDSHGEPSAVVKQNETGAIILGPLPLRQRDTADAIAHRLRDYAYNQYLRGLRVANTQPTVQMELVPIEVSDCDDPSMPTVNSCELEELNVKRFISKGQQLNLPIGTWFKIRLHPAAEPHPCVSVLDLVPDGTVALLWPPPGTKDPTKLEPGKTKDVPALYQAAEPVGKEVLMLVASAPSKTNTCMDFEPFVTKPMGQARGEGNKEPLGPFAPLFDDKSVRTRGTKAVFNPGALSTQSLTLNIVPKDGYD